MAIHLNVLELAQYRLFELEYGLNPLSVTQYRLYAVEPLPVLSELYVMFVAEFDTLPLEPVYE